MIQAVIHGLLLAIGLILPLGAQNIFVFNQGANQTKFRHALPAVITAGLCDSLLIVLAVIGVSLILMSFPLLQIVVYIIGLVFLLYMAWSLWHEQSTQLDDQRGISPAKQISFALSVSLLNPHAIMDTIGVIGTSASAYAGSEKIAFTIATISISWLWFIFLAIAGRSVGHFDKSGRLLIILNKISSIIIVIVALMILQKMFHLLF
ncbi:MULTISPECIES: LysE/ArgO family amino acid transporter [Staphylococcus]|uniref:LysE/ArgO family amino acid transporter n=1 Tax=Staphylococcus TaxID=1279 RepID=UPI0008A9002B|nr:MULTISPECIES: LysE family transporter [Staphylococcus]MCQ9279799.1 LysE family transporter [Staphylococcus borealis]OHR83296.1 lysine transporter LysE [Staphylococcus sp. HMSC34C02]PTK66354.1 lysine transporter LysE [Staphylococcus borealis]RIO69689.1 amino acid transporter [Staphylococcus borealis]